MHLKNKINYLNAEIEDNVTMFYQNTFCTSISSFVHNDFASIFDPYNINDSQIVTSYVL